MVPFQLNKIRMAFIAALWLLLFSIGSQAQNDVMVSVQVLPPYSTKIDTYERDPKKVIITLRNQSQTQSSLNIQLMGSMIGENGIVIRTGSQFRSPQPITLLPGETKILDAMAIRDLFNIDKLEVTGTDASALRSANGLPEGTYRICARAYDYYRPTVPLSVDEPFGCSNPFRITNLEPPILIKPYVDEVVNATSPQNLLFTWSFPAGAPPATLFTLKIVEIFNTERNINDAMLSSTTPAFFEQRVTGNAFLFGPAQPTLIRGRKYAFMVTATDPFNQTVFRNGGRSEVSAFTYGEAQAPAGFPNVNAFKVKNAVGPIVCECLEAVPGGGVDNSKAIVGSKVKIGKFEMTVLEVKEEAGVLVGRGKINFPMINSKLIPILVEFNNLQVNGSNQALSGIVKAKVKEDADFIPNAPAPNIQSLPFSLGDAQKLDEYFQANVNQLVSNINTAIDNAGFEMPLGLDKNIGGIGTVIAITGATFTPEQATFEAATVVNIPDGATKVALGAKNVCMDNSGLCGQGTLYLAEDFNIAALNIKLKGTAAMLVNPLDSGTYVVFDKDGFKKLRIQAEYEFPKSMLVKKTDKVSQVKATLTTTALSWSDWKAKVDIEPFYLAGDADFGFSLIGSGIYDHSSTSNPVGMPVIPAKTNITTPDWNGFYLPNLTVELPPIIQKSSGGGPLTAAVKDLIIDNQGLSGSVNATNVLAIGDGDLGGWYYSVDNIGVNFLNNSFISGGMKGKLILPISGGDPANPKGQLDYTSTLSKPAGSLEFQFVIVPKNDLDVPMWYSKFTLAKTSNILVTAGAGKFYAGATLNGSMDIIADLSPLSKINFRAMEFEELKVQTIVPYFDIKKFHAGLASPSKSLSGFPIGLSEIKPVISGANVGIGFTMKVSLCDIALVPEADFGFEVLGKLDFKGKRPDWKYDKVSLKKFGIKGDLGPVAVNGEVKFFDNDPEFGNGLSGTLDATFLSGFHTDAKVLFGNTNFFYWYVDARVKFPVGIPFSPPPVPLSVFGFGGGAYYHLAQKPLLNPKDLYGAPPALTNLYTPNVNTAGFKATIILGVSDGSSFQASGTFESTVNAKTMAPIMMKLQIDAAMLSPLMNTEKAFIKGTGVISYDFANDIFDAAVGVNVSLAGIIDGHGFVHLNVNGGAKQWFFKVGEPSDRVTLSVLSFVNFDSYFMMGNSGIPGIPPPPPQVLNQIAGYKPIRMPGVETGKGLAFGASMSYGPADLEFLIFYLRLGAGLGFDISLREVSEGCNGNTNLPGIDGWYANGQMYMWAEFAFGISVDEWFFTGRVPIAELEAAALLRAGLPNPSWFDGWLHGQYNILGGLISGQMNFHVEVGDKCIPASDPFGGIPLISEVSPEGNDISILADPQVAFNYPVESSFEIPTLDDKGNEISRTFLIEMNQFDVVNESTGKIVCSRMSNRAFKMSEVNKLATIYTNEAFEPKSKYKIRVNVQAFEIVGGNKIPCKHKGKTVEEYKEVAFTTGACVTKLDANSVLATYPVSNQRYLLQKESPTGFVELSKGISCLLTDNKYELVGIFTSYKSPGDYASTEVPVAYNGSSLTFNIPSLPNEQIAEVKIVKRFKMGISLFAGGNNIVPATSGTTMALYQTQSNFTYEKLNKYLGQYNFVEVKTSALKGVSESLKKVPDVELYKFYFKTSKFNTLPEKLSHSEISATAQKTTFGLLELYGAEYGMDEGFDVYDVNGFTYKAFGGSFKIGPLIKVSESSPRNKWSENYIRHDFYYNWMKGFYGGFIEELSPRHIRSFNTPIDEAIAFAPSSGPIDFRFNTIDPPLSTSEIREVVSFHNLKMQASEMMTNLSSNGNKGAEKVSKTIYPKYLIQK